MTSKIATVKGVEIALPVPHDLEGSFRSDGKDIIDMIDKLEEKLTEVARSIDPATEEGRKKLKSLAYNVSRSKTTLEAQAKELTEEARAQVSRVNSNRNKLTDRLDALRDKIKKPALDWEENEAKRTAALDERMDALTADGLTIESNIDDVNERLSAIKATVIDETWDEYQEGAERAQTTAVALLSDLATRIKERMEQEAELAELRELKAQKQAEEDEKARNEARQKELAESAENTRKAVRGLTKIPEAMPDDLGQQRDHWVKCQTRLENINVNPEFSGGTKSALEDSISDASEILKTRISDLSAQIEQQNEKAKAEELKRLQEKAEADAVREKAEAEERHRKEMADALAAQEREREEKAKADELERQNKLNQKNLMEKIEADIAAAIHGMKNKDIPAALIAGKIPHMKVDVQ